MGTHKHSIYDTDPHFSIDPVTRSVKNLSETKVAIVQGDHNSERFTFECPRFVDGHDMSLCNVVQIHYLNMDQATRETYSGLYEVEDLQLSPEDENVVVLSWLISGQATRYVGPLTFVVRFTCTIDGVVEYAWNTAIHQGFNVVAGINSGEAVVEDFADVLLEWEQELKANQIIDMQQTQVGSGDGGTNIWTATFGDGRKSELKVLNGRKGDKGDKGEPGNPEALRRYGETVKGETVRLDNVLPDPYSVKVKAKSKNILPYPYMMTSGVVNGITYTVNGDGSVTANGTATENAIFTFFVKSADEPLHFLSNGTYTLSCTQTEGARFMYGPVDNGVRGWVTVPYEGATVTLTDNYFIRNLYIEITKGTTVNNFTFCPQVEEGDTATAWAPYVDVTGKNVSSCGKNLLPYPYRETTKTSNGVTLTDNGDGSITLNGTATAQAWFAIDYETELQKGKTYTISLKGGRTGGVTINFGYFLPDGTNKYLATYVDAGRAVVIPDNYAKNRIHLDVQSGAVFNNVTVYPQLELGDTATEWEAYKKGETLTIGGADELLDIAPICPSMTLVPNVPGVVLEATHNDTLEAFHDVQKDISDLDASMKDSILHHKNIYVLEAEPSDLSAYKAGDIICIVEATE